MSLATTVKRAPKWAWYTVGGVAVGGIGLRLYKNRQTPADTTAQTDTTADPNSYSYGAGGVSGVIVPPVILPAQDSTGDASGLLGSILGGVSDLTGLVLGSVETLIGPTQESQQGLIDGYSETLSTLAIMNAGSPPTGSQNGAPVISTPVPSAPATPPIVLSQTPQPTSSSCPSTYPNPGANPGSCYKVVCLSTGDGHGHGKGKWHVYRDGTWRQVSTSC